MQEVAICERGLTSVWGSQRKKWLFRTKKKYLWVSNSQSYKISKLTIILLSYDSHTLVQISIWPRCNWQFSLRPKIWPLAKISRFCPDKIQHRHFFLAKNHLDGHLALPPIFRGPMVACCWHTLHLIGFIGACKTG